MENNGQNSQHNQSHHHHHPHQGCCDHGGAEKNREESNANNPSKLKNQSQKTAAIALGVLMFVSIGLIGFEVISNNFPEFTNQTVKGSKSLLILSQDREKEGAGLIASLAPSVRDREGSESDPIREANRLQSNKIRALQRQLVEANQKLHEVKAHLFTKGDPSDRARLSEICQDLVEKERHSNEIREKLTVLEAEKEQSLQKFRRMEQTVDALASMTDTLRETKEQAILTFQAQVEQLQNSAKEERQQLERTLAELEESQLSIKEALAEKMSVIKNLETEVSWQYTVLHDKDKEMQTQAKLYSTSDVELKKQLQDVIAAMEIEILKNHNLKSELDVAQAKENAQHLYAKTLEDRILLAQEKALDEHTEFANSQISLAKEYVTLNGLLDVYANAHNQFSSKHGKLAALVREEKSRADALQNELERTIAKVDAEQQKSLCFEEELHHTAYNLTVLKGELGAQQTLLERKQQDLETLAYSSASIKDQLQEKISQIIASLEEEKNTVQERNNSIRDLTISLELERTRTQELDHNLKQALASNSDQTQRGDQLEEELHQKKESLAALEERIQDKQFEIEELKQQVAETSKSFNLEKSRSQELHKALVVALEENESDQFQIVQLQETVSQNVDTLTLLQDRLNDKKINIDELEARMDQLLDDLYAEKQRSEELQNSLAVALAEKEATHIRASNLETDVSSHSKKIVKLQDSITDKQQEVRSLLDKVEQLNLALDHESTLSKTLQRELQTALSKHESQLQRSQSLEQTVTESEREIRALQKQLNDVAYNYDSEKSRSSNLEENLQSTLSKLENKEKTLNEVSTDHNLTRNEYETLKAELQRLRQEREELAKKAKSQEVIILHQQDLLHQKVLPTPARESVTREVERVEQEYTDTDSYPDTKHAVEPGETLSMLSVYYYGTPNRWIDIYNANRDVIADKDNLQPGTTLVIPR